MTAHADEPAKPRRTAALIGLSEPLQEPMSLYVARVDELWGPRALALAIYGRAAVGKFDPARDVITSALILEQVELAKLRELAGDGGRLGAYRIAAPLVFTPVDLDRSCDTFPLELIEIRQRHITIFGADFFAPLTFAKPHVRLQCERELKVIQIRIEQALLAACGQEGRLVRVYPELAERLWRVLRGLLWLKGYQDPLGADDTMRLAEAVVSRSLASITGILSEADRPVWETVQSAYEDVKFMQQFVDAL